MDTLTDHGADFVKVYTNLSREAYFAIMDQARKRGIHVDGHVPFRVLPAEAADAGQRTFEHLLAMALGCSTEADVRTEGVRPRSLRHGPFSDGRTEPAGAFPARAPSLRDAKSRGLLGDDRGLQEKRAWPRLLPWSGTTTWSTRTRSFRTPRSCNSFRRLFAATGRKGSTPRRAGQSARSSAPWFSLQVENTRLLHEAGVMLLAATDVGIPMLVPGLSLHEELALLVEAGLTPLEALRTATVNPARVLGMADSLGTIEADKLADLVLLDAEPAGRHRQYPANPRRRRQRPALPPDRPRPASRRSTCRQVEMSRPARSVPNGRRS